MICQYCKEDFHSLGIMKHRKSCGNRTPDDRKKARVRKIA